MTTKEKAELKAEVFKKVGAHIAWYRKSHGYTQTDLAKLMVINPGVIARIERGVGGFDLFTLAHIAAMLEVPLSFLLPAQDLDTMAWAEKYKDRALQHLKEAAETPVTPEGVFKGEIKESDVGLPYFINAKGEKIWLPESSGPITKHHVGRRVYVHNGRPFIESLDLFELRRKTNTL